MDLVQERWDTALVLVEVAGHRLLATDEGRGLGLMAARRCLDVQDLLLEAGAEPGGVLADTAVPAVERLVQAEAELDAIDPAERGLRWGPVRVELRALTVHASRV